MNNKIAVVVGGTGFIGREIVIELSQKEFIVICISKSSNILQFPVDNVISVCCDMTIYSNVEQIVSNIIAEYKNIDLLVNAIGKNINVPLNDITEIIWNDVIDTNVKSVFFTCRAIGNEMVKNGKGIIINFASTAGIRSDPESPHYIVAKAGVIALTKYFAQLYAPNIRVNCIAPGFVLTDNHKRENYLRYNEVINQIPIKQMVSVNEIVKSTMYLIDSQNITGHTLVIDGGLIL